MMASHTIAAPIVYTLGKETLMKDEKRKLYGKKE
jgi:hypothetical protein